VSFLPGKIKITRKNNTYCLGVYVLKKIDFHHMSMKEKWENEKVNDDYK